MPRIQVSVSNDLKAVLDDIKELSGSPSSKLITTILEETLPAFKLMRSTLQSIEDEKANTVKLVKDSAGKLLELSQAKQIELKGLVSELDNDEK